MRLIDADALIHELEVSGILFHYGTQIVQKINNMSTADKPQGEWIDKEVRGSIEPYCSKCGRGLDVIYHYNFCPNCGAQMIEPQESEE